MDKFESAFNQGVIDLLRSEAQHLGPVVYSSFHAPSSLVFDAAPAALRGSAFGVFHPVTGRATLLGSLIAGSLWAAIGQAASFLGGAVFTAIGLGGLVALTLRPPR